MSKLEKVATPEGFVYYVDKSLAKDKEDDHLPMSGSDYKASEDEETELPPEFFGCTQETSLNDLPLMAPEFSSPVGGGEINMREIESFQRTFAECLAEDNFRVKLNEEIGTVVEDV